MYRPMLNQRNTKYRPVLRQYLHIKIEFLEFSKFLNCTHMLMSKLRDFPIENTSNLESIALIALQYFDKKYL